MNIGKGIFRFFTGILFFVALVIFAGIVTILTIRTNGLTGFAENPVEVITLLGSMFTMILINVIRLKMGMHMALTKKSAEHQALLMVFFIMVLVGLALMTIHAYVFAGILFAIGVVGTAIVKQRMWSIFTDIRESDHEIFKKRLVKSGILVIALAVLSNVLMNGGTIISNTLYSIYYGYFIASFFIGFVVVRGFFAPMANVVADWQDSEKIQEEQAIKRQHERDEIDRAMGRHTTPTLGPKSDLWIANIMGLTVFVSIGVTALAVGVFLIPFYIYVLSTKKVTITEPLPA